MLQDSYKLSRWKLIPKHVLQNFIEVTLYRGQFVIIILNIFKTFSEHSHAVAYLKGIKV